MRLAALLEDDNSVYSLQVERENILAYAVWSELMEVQYTVLSPTERFQFNDRHGLEDPDLDIR